MFSKEQRAGHDERHKCSHCGRVRYGKFMRPLVRGYSRGRSDVQMKTRYGNGIWYCRDNATCREKVEAMNIY
jgi:hypothetical protein